MPDIDISPFAAISAAWLCLMTEPEFIPAVIIAVIVHECAHLAAMRLFGMQINALRLELSGLCIEYCGFYSYWEQFITALAGPAAGIVYAYAASFLAAHFTSPLLSLSAGLSLLFSLFNLLPALPLDGGRMLEAVLGQKSDKAVKFISLAVGVMLLLLGAFLLYRHQGAALFIAGNAIVAANLRYQMR